MLISCGRLVTAAHLHHGGPCCSCHTCVANIPCQINRNFNSWQYDLRCNMPSSYSGFHMPIAIEVAAPTTSRQRPERPACRVLGQDAKEIGSDKNRRTIRRTATEPKRCHATACCAERMRACMVSADVAHVYCRVQYELRISRSFTPTQGSVLPLLRMLAQNAVREVAHPAGLFDVQCQPG